MESYIYIIHNTQQLHAQNKQANIQNDERIKSFLAKYIPMLVYVHEIAILACVKSQINLAAQRGFTAVIRQSEQRYSIDGEQQHISASACTSTASSTSIHRHGH